jgi:hypothetical protein
MPSVYPTKIQFRTLEEAAFQYNRLVDLLNKDLSVVVIGGGVGDVKSPIVPGVIDSTIVVYDGITGKRIKASTIYANWFDQSVTSTSSPTFVKPTVNGTQFNIAATPATNAEGLLQWNATDGTLDLGMSGGAITQQIGQELFTKVINKTASTIVNGSPVYFDGRLGWRPKIKLAKSDAEVTSAVMGITTQDIAPDAEGYITTLGYVRQIKTDYATWAEGQPLYVSKTTAGALTNVEPTAPHHSDIVGYVGVVGGAGIGSILVKLQHHTDLEHITNVDGNPFNTNGQILTYNNDTGIHTAMSQFPVSNHYTGFPNLTDTTIGFNDGTYTLTLTASAKPIWINGIAYTIDTLTKQLSVAQEAVSGLYWFWLSVSANVISLNCQVGSPGFDKCLVATVYWNTTTNKGLISDERHYMGRDKWMHEYLHETVGARYANGMAGTFTNTTFSIGAGEFYDEDLEHKWTSPLTTAHVLYHNGDADWVWDTLTTPYKVVNPGVDNNLRYNNGTALATVANNKYVNSWFFATGDVANPIDIFIGTAEYITIADARAATPPSFGALISAETKLIFKVTFKNNGGTPNYIEATDYRTASILPTGSYVATSHSTLTDLTYATSGHSGFLPDTAIDDTAYGAGWNGDVTHAPTKNAVYDKIETMTSASVSDEAYGGTWDGITTVAPSKNAVYDVIASLAGGHPDVTIGSPANGLSVDGSQVLSLGLASTSTIGALSDTDWDTFNGKADHGIVAGGTTGQALVKSSNTDYAVEWADAGSGACTPDTGDTEVLLDVILNGDPGEIEIALAGILNGGS